MSKASPDRCPFCSLPYHDPQACPRVSAVEFFYRSHRVKRVELWPLPAQQLAGSPG